ncbi:MAG: hypothetical protein K2O53_04505 [Bacteroidales bacterium]|nr:hypothetical protein [Bacteroidales bacterium]
METLRSKLEAFHPKSEKELDGIFLDLAESFLYGGYISVTYNNKERYRIYLRTVEFYCHPEKDSNWPNDFIVYHRNGRYVDGEVPYFPLMAFHAHASGVDITFEKEKYGLRSSALIRAYEIYDVAQKAFLTYKTKDEEIVACKTEKGRVNTQSTYLYDFLNGFIHGSEGDFVAWKDFKDDVWKNVQRKKIESKPRQNVYECMANGKPKEPKKKDERKWRFTRTEDLPF